MGVGIGGGIGPIRVGTSISDDELAGCFTYAIAFGLVALAIFWPYLLGDWIAGQFGAAEESAARAITGWTLEAIYVGAAIWIWIALTAEAEREQEAEQLEAEQRAAEQTIARFEKTAAVATRILARMDAAPGGSVATGLPATERLLYQVSGVHLIEPRVVARGSERVPTAVAFGDVVVSDKAVRFRSEERQVEWLFRKMHSKYEGPDRLTFGVTNRQTVSGIGGSTLVPAILKGLVLWAEALPSDPGHARAYFESLRDDCRDTLARLS